MTKISKAATKVTKTLVKMSKTYEPKLTEKYMCEKHKRYFKNFNKLIINGTVLS